jgi:hypothetical protein
LRAVVHDMTDSFAIFLKPIQLAKCTAPAILLFFHFTIHDADMVTARNRVAHSKTASRQNRTSGTILY